MSITHEEARQLIQFKADRLLKAQERSALEAHLSACQACTTYAGQIQRMELDLRQVLNRQWQAAPRPLRAADIQRIPQPNNKWIEPLVPMRKLIAAVATMVFALTIWQFALSGREFNSLAVAEVSPNPTPSISISTGTQDNQVACNELQYRVHSGETLASIAEKFSIPLELLAEHNHLSDHELEQLSHLIIPLCTLTPASTDHAPESTLTPGLQTFTTTPG
jgi:predicted anti-sigma-YlaC factor YlaD